ncbi:ARM repeat-containing protein [Martensiomyces pterosporus]|nr:ARM repeat-containing protein [Martensiomyces pterosporus]
MDARQSVVLALEEVSSQNPARMAAAEKSLKEWETRPMFHATLFDIFADRSLPTGVRWLAIISLKNGIDKYWKKTATHTIQLDEKELIRPRLLSLFDESTPQIAVQYCVAVSRIARWEFPRVWPEFAEELLTCVRAIASDERSACRHVMEQNVLYTLHLFIKSLCSRTLAKERQALREITPVIFNVVAPIYGRRIAQFNEALQAGDSAESQALLREIRLCLKTLRRLLIFGYEKPTEADEAAKDFYLATIGHQAAFYELFKSLPAESRDSDDCTVLKKIILLYGKMYLDFQKYHAVRFITMPGVKAMLEWYWVQIQDEAPKMVASMSDLDSSPEPVLEPVLVQGLTLYKSVIKNYFYMADDDGTMDSNVKRCRQVIDGEILTAGFVEQMANTLMYSYIPLKAKDLLMWQDDPEAWLTEEDSDYWAFDVRRCAEHVFTDLVSQNKELLVPQLMQAFQEIDGQTGSDAAAAFFRREGLYAALGLCANELYSAFDFCGWLKQHHAADSPMGAVKWRIAWLVGQWVRVKFAVEERPSAYTVLLELMRREEPLVVRMAAVSSLLLCVDDWDFEAGQFAPFLGQSIERITQVLGDVALAESRMRIVNFLGVIVGRMQGQIVPFAESVVQLLPPLWQSAAGENLYQTAILSLVSRLVEALGPQSAALHGLISPLIQHSVDLTDPAHVYLIEDGIELWLALIRNASQLDQSLMSLLHYTPGLLQYSTETLKHVLKVIEGYVLLDGVSVFQNSGVAIIGALGSLLSDPGLAVRAIAVAFSTLNIIVQRVPVEFTGKALMESNVIWTAFTKIVDNNEAALLLAHHAGFISRVAVHYPVFFAEFLATQDRTLTSAFVSNWIGIFDNVGQVAQRRLHALSLAAAIATTNDGVLEHLPLMVPVWTEIMSDTGNSLVYFSDVDDDMPDDCGESAVAENARRRKLLAEDPAHRFDIKMALDRSLAECERLNGPERFQAIIARVSAEDLEDLKNQLR